MKTKTKKVASKKVEVLLTVYRQGSEFFATRTFPGNTEFEHPNTIFTMRERLAPEDMEEFEERARAKAKQNGLPFVNSLSKR